MGFLEINLLNAWLAGKMISGNSVTPRPLNIQHGNFHLEPIIYSLYMKKHFW